MIKRVLLFITMILLSGCSIAVTGPYTGTSYKMGVEKEKGLYLQAKPPGWDKAAEIGDKIIQDLSE